MKAQAVRRALAAAVVAALCARPDAAPAARSEVYALVGARIVTVSGPTHDRGTLVMRDGVIEAVGPDGTVPPDARVIRADNLVLTPGLIDGFSGTGLPTVTARPGGTAGSGAAAAPPPSSLVPQAMALDRVRVADALKARDAGITTVLVIPREGVLPGQSVILNLSGDKAEAMALKQPAALHLHMSTLARQYPGSLMGTVAYARQSLDDAIRYRDEWAAYERSPAGQRRPRYDPALAAWQEVLAGREMLVVTAFHENDVRRALAIADEFKIKVAVAGAPQAFRVADLVKSRQLPLLVSVNFDPPRPATFFGSSLGDEEKERRDIEEAERNPAELHKAGVSFALVSAYAPNFLAGVRKAIERGLPRDVALQAVTLGAAQALGIADRTGSLEPGKIANVVAWSGEPLTKDAKARMVFVDGQLYEPDETPAPSPSPKAEAGDADGGADGAVESPQINSERGRSRASVTTGPILVAIVGGTILTVGAQGTIEKGTVLIRDGKIAAVGRDVAVPAGATVIQASGRYVMPGIIDGHSHTAIEGSVNECSDSVTAEVRIADVIDQHDANIYRQLGGGVTTINVLHGSCNTIGGQNAVLKLRWGRPPEELVFKDAPRGIKFALGENVKRSNFRAPGPPRYPATRMGVEAVLRESFQEAQAYKREWDEYEKKARAAKPTAVAPRKSLRLEELKDVLDGKVYVHAHCYRADEILMLIRVAEEFGFKIRTFQHVLEGYKVASEIARHGAGASTFSDWWAYKMEAYDAIPYNAAIMAAHGVKVSMNSDSDELARRLYWEAAKAMKYGGVSEAEALKMVTLNPAWQLGIDKRVGSIEVGKDADIAIFSAHPFAPDTRVEQTLVDGIVYFDRSKDVAARTAPAKAEGVQ
jgi:imidazolonepropionase-like amidohydrolase